MSDLERRMIPGHIGIEEREDGSRVLVGHASVFVDPSDPGTRFEIFPGMVEEVDPGAFERALEERQDVVGLFNHDASRILGRTTADTLRLSTDQKGLRFEVDLGDTSTGRDVEAHVRRGDLTGASFAFIAKREEFREEDDGVVVRRLLDVDLFDVGPVTFPAYSATQVGLRAKHLDTYKRAIAPDASEEREFYRRKLWLLTHDLTLTWPV